MIETVTWEEAVRRILFLMVDVVIDANRRDNWRLVLWPHRRVQWARYRALLGWWRSTWVAA